KNVVSNDDSFHVLNTPVNSSGGSPDVVNDGMDSGPSTDLFVDPKVVEGVDKPVLESISNVKVSTIPKSFASLVTNEAVTSKFASIEGMNGVLENGPWFIRSAPIIVKKWTPNANLLKEYMNLVPIWVKFHDIPIVAFTTEGLSVMATKLGKKVVQDVAGLASGSPSITPLVARINDLESQMIAVKLVSLEDEGKPLKPCKPKLPSSSNVVFKKVDDLVNEDSDSEVGEIYDETTTYMDSTSSNVNKASKSGSGGEIKSCMNNQLLRNAKRTWGVEASSNSPKHKEDMLMLEWYDKSTPAKASSASGSVIPKLIPKRLFIQPCDETMKTVDDVIGDVIRCIDFDVMDIGKQFDVGYVDVIYLISYKIQYTKI
ncbi:ribonuclease H-like domain-containing protein, partial [Tanacetum coccineum]